MRLITWRTLHSSAGTTMVIRGWSTTAGTRVLFVAAERTAQRLRGALRRAHWHILAPARAAPAPSEAALPRLRNLRRARLQDDPSRWSRRTALRAELGTVGHGKMDDDHAQLERPCRPR